MEIFWKEAGNWWFYRGIDVIRNTSEKIAIYFMHRGTQESIDEHNLINKPI